LLVVLRRKGHAAAQIAHRQLAWQRIERLLRQAIERGVTGQELANLDELDVHLNLG
jgi:hypothetical protein